MSEFIELEHQLDILVTANADLKDVNKQLVEALEAGCESHHLPLINGWAHKTERHGKVIRCRLSKQAREALALTGKEREKA